ncbi:MAG: hypothetical protein ACTSPO_10670 [Candidatus Heimdallarchaeaceae archaeon]
MSDLVEYSTKNSKYTSFSFTWVKIATLVIIGYYVSEMIAIITYLALVGNSVANLQSQFATWLIIDTSFYSLALVFIAIQALIWRNTSTDYDTRSKSRLAFIMLIITAFLTPLYEVLLILQSELDYSHQSDNATLIIFMIIAHFYSLLLVKQIITSIGRSKSAEAGGSVFYTLFGLKPAITNILWIVPLVFSMEYSNIFTAYAELIMVYLTGVLAIGFTIAIWKDARMIKINYLLASAKKEKEVIKKEEIELVLTDQSLFVTEEKSKFCIGCGIRIDPKTSKCPKCGQSQTIT